MKYLVFLFSISISVSSYGTCQAPGQSFLEEKLKESFATAPVEKELKEIALDPKNYALREEIKSLNRRSLASTRIQNEQIMNDSGEKFSQMMAARNTDELPNFPVPGANSKLSSANNSLAIEVSNLSKEDLDVLPPKVLEKLGNKVRIHYMYPYDKFEYVLTYDGRELPMKKAFLKMQNDYEDACDERLAENQHARDLHELDRKSRGLGKIQKVESSGSSRGSAGQ